MRALLARALLSLLAVAALTAVALLRLARVPRPQAAVAARYAGGRVVVERVSLGRRALGHTVRCDGRALLSRFGERPPTLREEGREAEGALVFSDGECRLTVHIAGCRGEASAGCGRAPGGGR